MLHLYQDSAATKQISDDHTATAIIDTYQGDASTGETTAPRKLWLGNDDASRTYTGVALTAQGDTTNQNLQYAPDNAGAPGTFAESITLADGDYRTAVAVWVQCIFAKITNGVPVTVNANHKITAAKVFAQ